MLAGLAHVLKKAEANATERKIDPSVFLNARLAPDMLPLTHQIHDRDRHGQRRVSTVWPDTKCPRWKTPRRHLTNFRRESQHVIEMVNSFRPRLLTAGKMRRSRCRAEQYDREFKALGYLFGYAIPNFAFHVVTAYDILRHNGVTIGKPDYFGRGT